MSTLAAGGGLTLLGIVVIGVLFIFSGLYNVAASKKHLDVTTWLLDIVRRQSVRTHTLGMEAPALDDPDMVRLGASHFAGGCALCHGSPATERSPLAGAMLPEPPALDQAAIDWSAEQLFWIVKYGQKYTGMPHWIAPERDDEVWAVTAFLKQLPSMDAETYEAFATAGAGFSSENANLGFGFAGDGEELANCVRCHGTRDQVPASDLVPWLGGQTQAYLERALREYGTGTRLSGVMQLAASDLTDDQVAELSAYYAAGSAVAFASGEPDPAQIERGAIIFSSGAPEDDVPACISCHSGLPASPFPRIAGQSMRYVEQQLQVFKDGLRDQTAYGRIMSVIAQRLTRSDMADVAAYLQSLPPPSSAAATAAVAP